MFPKREGFALFSRIETIRLVTDISNINNWSIHQMDVKPDFLNGPMEEEVKEIDNVSAIQLEKNPIAHRRRNLPSRAGQETYHYCIAKM